jgi:hypothetical protein
MFDLIFEGDLYVIKSTGRTLARAAKCGFDYFE